MQKIEAIIRPERLDEVKNALAAVGVSGLNIVHVTGRGVQKGIVHMGRGGETYEVDMLPKVKIEVVVPDDRAGRGVQKGIVHMGRGGETYEVDMLPKVKIEVVVPDDRVERLVNTICQAAKTGRIGDGKIFVIPVADAIRVRTGERGDAAL